MAASFDDIFRKATQSAENGWPFVIHAKPGYNQVTAIFQNNQSVDPFDFSTSGFVFCSFDGQNQWFIADKSSEKLVVEIPESAAPPLTNPTPSYTEKEKSAFEQLVSKGIAAINSGEMRKVVLSRKETVAIHADFAAVFTRMLIAYPKAFRYCWFHQKTGLWMGATPEQLLTTDGNAFSTVALAGTQPFIHTEQVLWQEKEKIEQQFVTDYIADGLQNEVSEIHLSEPYTTRAGNLLHIKTDINGKFAGHSSLKKALEILHPTPAVCGYPKPDAKRFILENEKYDREFYSGYLGEIGDGKSDLFVNLRCMKIEQNSAHLYIGCGITAGSDPEKEFEETVNKALTMKKVLS